MGTKINRAAIETLSRIYGLSYAQVMMIVGVESSGTGFSKTTGKMIIQFEPRWFQKKYAMWKKHQGIWLANSVGDQKQEWIAYTNAFSIDAQAAMQATSIGMMQVMGFHYQLLGFRTVGDMWKFAEESEANQLELGLKFIHKNPKLYEAVKKLDYREIAYNYNGEQYELYDYHNRLAKEFKKFANTTEAPALAKNIVPIF